MPNKYVIPTLPNIDPRVTRVIRDLADRTNYLTEEIGRVKTTANDVSRLAGKQSPVPGILTIPSINGDGFVRVSKDGVIASYTNPAMTPLIATGGLFTNVDTLSISNDASEVSVLDDITATQGSSRTIIDTPGSIYRLRSVGNIGSTVGTNLNLQVKIGGVTIADNGNPVMTNVAVGRYFLDVDFIVNTGGSTGQVVGFTMFQYGNVPGGITTLVTHTNGVLIAVDFTNPQLDFTVTWSVASPAHFLQAFIVTVEKIR